MAQVQIESRIVDWDHTDGNSKTISFNSKFEDLPVVCVLAQVLETPSARPADVNTYIAQVTKTSVTVGTSAIFNGQIHLQAIYKTW